MFSRLPGIVSLGLALLPVHLCADTVYLKNGNWIDGVVRTRNDEMILVEIGEVGKVEIRLEEVYEIEKNSRTGSGLLLPVEGRQLDADVNQDARDESPGDAPRAPEESNADTEAGDRRPKKAAEEEEEIDPELKERIEQLVHDLQRQQSRYRVRAERHLKAIGATAIPFLLPLVTHESDLVRIAVLRLFETFGDDRVIEKCIGALADTNEYVREYAHRTLQRITKEDFGYRPYAPPQRREAAQKKWEKWWKEEQERLRELEEAAR